MTSTDGFTPVDPGVAAPDLSGTGADDAVAAAKQDLRAARHDLRRARHENGAKGQVDRAIAHQDIRAAKAELAAARQAASGQDTFGNAAARPVDLAGGGHVDPSAGPGNRGNGLALGHQREPISQLHPQGEEGGYENAEMNCAPAAMAMVARGHPGAMLDGKPVDQMSDAELINRLGGHGQTDKAGTSPNGVIAMAEDLGLTTSTQMGGFDPAFYDSVLEKGGTVIANGARDIDGQLAGHFVAVTGKTADGNYLVNDPWSGRTEVYSPAQLDAFLRSNQVNGGVSIGMF